MSAPAILIAGGLASTAMVLVFGLGRALGATRLSVPLLLGTAITPDRRQARRLGVALLLAYGWALSPLFARMLASSRHTGLEAGVVVGLALGLLILVAAPAALPMLHPRMASPARGALAGRGLVPPGWLALHYGGGTAVVTLLAHAAYGGVLGALLAPWVSR